MIVIEDLKAKNLQKNHHLAKAIANASWYQFRTMMEYKCDWYGKQLIIVIAVLIHGRTVNVLQNKYFEPKYEGIDTQGYITYKSRYQLYKSIGDILVKKAKLTKMETEAIFGDGSNTSYILDGDKVNDYLEEHYFDLSNTDKEHLSLFKR